MVTKSKQIIIGILLLMVCTTTFGLQVQPVAAADETFFDKQFGAFGLVGWSLLPEAKSDFTLRRDWSGYAQVKESDGDDGIRAYATHNIDLRDWTGNDDLTINFRYSATSSYSGSSQVTQFRIGIMDAALNVKWSFIARSTSTSIAWTDKTLTIPHEYLDAAEYTIYFGVYDAWDYCWNMKANCDYITVSGQAK
ncbi:hypothetical protein EU528_01050 [Candidatus Thorarchaeota archaeon]|nr:MAG: hypothetical protein EU528_01050 [Candidatus Thorarchaeota archaeon]